MNNCPSCGHQRVNNETRCPECGAYYSKIFELIAEEEAYELEHSFRGHWQKILNAADKKQAVSAEFKQFWTGLTVKAKFTLFVIFVFVFAMTAAVL
jgi:uncharacterized membrane protein YvbJ